MLPKRMNFRKVPGGGGISENSSDLAQPSFPKQCTVLPSSLMVFFTAMGSDGVSPKNVFTPSLRGDPCE